VVWHHKIELEEGVRKMYERYGKEEGRSEEGRTK